MPRDRQIVMGKISPQEAAEAAIKKAIKLYSPYEIVAGELVGIEEEYAVVYTAPRGDQREVVSGHEERARAKVIRDRCNRAWVLGFRSSGGRSWLAY